MARPLETNELVPVAVNLILPGVGHMFSGQGAMGALFFFVAVIIIFFAPFGVCGIGLIAAGHLYWVLSNEEPEQKKFEVKLEPKKLTEEEEKRKALEAAEEEEADEEEADEEEADEEEADEEAADEEAADEEAADEEEADEEEADEEEADEEEADEEEADEEEADEEEADEEAADEEAAEADEEEADEEEADEEEADEEEADEEEADEEEADEEEADEDEADEEAADEEAADEEAADEEAADEEEADEEAADEEEVAAGEEADEDIDGFEAEEAAETTLPGAAVVNQKLVGESQARAVEEQERKEKEAEQVAQPVDEPAPDYSPDDFPSEIDEDESVLERLRSVLHSAETWHAEHDLPWERREFTHPDELPADLQLVAEQVGQIEFEPAWRYAWSFRPGAAVSLFTDVTPIASGYRFATTADGAALIWATDGRVLEVRDGEEDELEEDLRDFVDRLARGLEVAQWSMATEATLGREALTVHPADERDSEETSNANFPPFWFGARGPGMENVGFSIDAPYIRHGDVSRVAGQVDIAAIIAFHEWLDSEPKSPMVAMKLVNDGTHDVRPIGVVIREGDVAVAWWGESPPPEVDAFLDHLHNVDYYEE